MDKYCTHWYYWRNNTPSFYYWEWIRKEPPEMKLQQSTNQQHATLSSSLCCICSQFGKQGFPKSAPHYMDIINNSQNLFQYRRVWWVGFFFFQDLSTNVPVLTGHAIGSVGSNFFFQLRLAGRQSYTIYLHSHYVHSEVSLHPAVWCQFLTFGPQRTKTMTYLGLTACKNSKVGHNNHVQVGKRNVDGHTRAFFHSFWPANNSYIWHFRQYHNHPQCALFKIQIHEWEDIYGNIH